jgi:hypothetical protein
MSRITIGPIHYSLAGKRMLPRHMERLGMDREHYEAGVNIALSIFADCTNVGVSFQDALLAVYLSGLNHGASLSQEPRT